MTVEVSKLTGFAVLKPPTDNVVASKLTVYAVMKPSSGGAAPTQNQIIIIT